MRAVGYIRVSSEGQIDNWSLDAQRRAIEDFCAGRGWTLTEVYSEEGRSARSDAISRRPELQRLLADADRKAFDAVVVHSLDRWGRNLLVTLQSLSRLAQSGVSFVSISEQMDYSTPEGRMVVGMLGAVAQYFSDNLARHTSKGKRERVMQGLYNGDLPYGYCKGPDGIPNILGEEAELVRQMYHDYAGGMVSFAELAERANAQGALTRNKRKETAYGVTGPRPFTKESVKDIISNPFYCGMVRYKKEPSQQGQHPAIIDKELWEKCQQVRGQRRRGGRSVAKGFRPYLLKGLARCSHCGERLWCETVRGVAYYRSQYRGTPCPSGGGLTKAEVLDKQMDAIIHALVLPEDWREEVLQILETEDTRGRIVEERRQTETKLRRVGKLYGDCLISETEYELRRRELENYRAALVIPEEKRVVAAGEAVRELGYYWSEMLLEDKAAVLQTMLSAVYVDISPKILVGVVPRPGFEALFRCCPQFVVSGDPEGGQPVANPVAKLFAGIPLFAVR